MSLPSPTLPRCYRHPDREAGRSCTRCGKPACSDCLVQATVGSHCLDCAKAGRPDTRTRARYWNARQLTLVTYVMMGLNLAVFAGMTVLDPETMSGRITQAHVDLGLNKTIIAITDEWYRIVTAGFIHFGIIHIAFNMLLLYQLGQLLEPALGRAKFALLYVASLLGGSLGVLLLDGDRVRITGGASGAVFGLMGAAAIGLHRRGVNVFSTGIGTTLVLNLILTFSLRGISIGGHMGGVIAGGLCGLVMLAPRWKPVPEWATWATPIGIGLASVLVSVVVVG